MSAIWTVTIRCQRCETTYGPAELVISGASVGLHLRSMRSDAASNGWTTRRDTRNRILDFCPAHEPREAVTR